MHTIESSQATEHGHTRTRTNKKEPHPGRSKKARPIGAFKLLAFLLYSSYPGWIVYGYGKTQILACSTLGRKLGTDGKHLRRWLDYLNEQGYIEQLSYSTNRRKAQFRIRRPHNV